MASLLNCEKKVHLAYRKGKLNFIGKWQYIWSSPFGKISMVNLGGILGNTDSDWELAWIDGENVDVFFRIDNRWIAIQQVKSHLIPAWWI